MSKPAANPEFLTIRCIPTQRSLRGKLIGRRSEWMASQLGELGRDLSTEVRWRV